MAVFIGVHDMGESMSEEKMKGAWEAYKEACKKHGAEAHKTFMNYEKGKAFCLTEADSEKVVRDAHDDAGVPVNEVIEVQKLK